MYSVQTAVQRLTDGWLISPSDLSVSARCAHLTHATRTTSRLRDAPQPDLYSRDAAAARITFATRCLCGSETAEPGCAWTVSVASSACSDSSPHCTKAVHSQCCRSTVAQLYCNRSFGVFRSACRCPQMVRKSCSRPSCNSSKTQPQTMVCISADVELQEVAAMALQQSPGASSLSTPQ